MCLNSIREGLSSSPPSPRTNEEGEEEAEEEKEDPSTSVIPLVMRDTFSRLVSAEIEAVIRSAPPPPPPSSNDGQGEEAFAVLDDVAKR